MKPSTPFSYKAIIFSAFFFFITHIASAQCSITATIAGSATSCAGIDTLSLTGASTATQIVWQYGDTTVAIGSAGGTIDTTFIAPISGSYLAIITAPGGCLDTTASVTVYPAALDTITASICPSDSFALGTQYYHTSGIYSDTLHGASVNGCDSIMTLVLTVLPYATDVITASICASDSFALGTQYYHTSGIYSDTLHAAAVNGCDSIITLVLTVTTVTPSVSISTGQSNTICAGTKITFTAQPTYGGSSPTYQWYVTGIATDTSATFVDSTLHSGDSVWVVMVSNDACASTDTVTSNVIPYLVDTFVAPMVSIISINTGDTICDNTMSTLFATGTNGGNNPDYQWQRNGVNVGNSDTYIANTILNGDVFRCIITSTAACVTQVKDTSNSITFSVNPYPAVTISSSSGGSTACYGDTALLTAGGGASYIWSTGDTVPAIYSTGGTYRVTATSSYGCTAASLPFTLTQLPLATDTIYQVGDSLVSGTSQFYQWYYDGAIISGAIGPVYVPTANGEYQAATIDGQGCIAYSAIVTIGPAGISGVAAAAMHLYPNPNAGTFTLELGDNAPHTVTITDALGRAIISDEPVTHLKQFSMASLTDGIYYIRIGDSTVKFTVIR